MKIQFHGHACFSITEDKVTVVTDPYSDKIGMKFPGISGHIVTVSFEHEAHNNVGGVKGEPKVINWPGEYEYSGIYFKGIHSFHNSKEDKEQLENTIFTINIGGIRLCHLGAQGTKLTSEQLEQVGDVDILFVPVGGKMTVDAKKAKEIVEQIEPRVIIPMMYHTNGSKMGFTPIKEFVGLMGGEAVQPVDEFTVKKSELPEDNSKLVVLNTAP
ncbi:MBL fold metallo-hydrolase [Candidatus Peregrinibacteria bacterium]|nr:MBL fold metallo-hydrolase [Candidatus Peregrinibacteria bacterium]